MRPEKLYLLDMIETIKLPIVWETVNQDVPALRRQAAQILEQEDK
jgi:uncharacterized protein with HEPN domain